MSLDEGTTIDLMILREIKTRLAELNEETTEMRANRQATVRRLLDRGMTLADIADQLGVTRQRVHQWRNQR